MRARSSMRRQGRLLIPALLASVVAPAAAQTGTQWWALDSSPPGTPPGITLQTESDPQHTVLQVTIHGFYYETIVQAGQSFRPFTMPWGPSSEARRAIRSCRCWTKS